MNDFEGYLIKHESGCIADALYFTLGTGVLQYYSRKGGKWIGQIELTRHKVSVHRVDDASCPNKFVVRAVRSRTKYDSDDDYHPAIHVLELSASTNLTRKKWISAIVNWKRHGWGDTVVIKGYQDELSALNLLLKTCNFKSRVGKTLSKSLSRLQISTKQDISVDSSSLNRSVLFNGRQNCVSFHDYSRESVELETRAALRQGSKHNEQLGYTRPNIRGVTITS